jgi:CBS domain-containing protein
MIRVKEIMTRNVETINPNKSVKDAADKMRSLNVGVLPVGDADNLAGMLTDRDITVRAVAEGRDVEATPVKDIMTPNVTSCFEDQDIADVAALMKNNQIRRLVVLDSDKRLVGVCALGDLAVGAAESNVSAEVLEEVSKPTKPKE